MEPERQPQIFGDLNGLGSSQANRVVTLGESQAAQRALPLIMVLCADK